MITLLLALAQNPVVMTREPHAASPWVQSVQARCGNSDLLVSGYGARKPLEETAKVSVNGVPVTGSVIAKFQTDLSRRRAVYRLQILCGRLGAMTLRINVGERQRDGQVLYRSGAATIKGDALVSYTGLQTSDADGFWFR